MSKFSSTHLRHLRIDQQDFSAPPTPNPDVDSYDFGFTYNADHTEPSPQNTGAFVEAWNRFCDRFLPGVYAMDVRDMELFVPRSEKFPFSANGFSDVGLFPLSVNGKKPLHQTTSSILGLIDLKNPETQSWEGSVVAQVGFSTHFRQITCTPLFILHHSC